MTQQRLVKTYIAGPMTGYAEYNFPAFFEAEEWLRVMGRTEPINPADMDGGRTDLEWEYYLRRDLVALLDCQEIALLKGWERSKGATLEAFVAHLLKLRVRKQVIDNNKMWFEYAGSTYIPRKVDLSLLAGNTGDKGPVTLEAHKLVLGDRQSDYGHPFDDFSRTAKMWEALLGVEVRPEQVALCMIAVKLSRECNRHKRDNLVDIAGYAETCNMVKEYRHETL